MKAATISVAVFMLAILVVGCSDQSQVSGPQASALSAPVQKAIDNISIETTVWGPAGVKYHIVGDISYTLQVDGTVYALSTNADLHVNETASDLKWDAYGGTEYNSIIGVTEFDLVADSFEFQNGGIVAPYRIWIEFKVDQKGVSVHDIRVLESVGPFVETK